MIRTAPIWLPVAGTMAVAWYGQTSFARYQLELAPAPAALMGAFLECLMIGTNQRAHERRRMGDRAIPLRVFSAVCAVVASVMNYWHFAGPGFAPTQKAVTFGVASIFGFVYWEITSSAAIKSTLIRIGLRPAPRPIVTAAAGPRLSAARLVVRTVLHPWWTYRALDASLTDPMLSPLEAWRAAVNQHHSRKVSKSTKKKSR
ncbi:hypothetical protein ACFWX6_35360 [Amycolatopsis sp. NPDC059019]|uniref:hypothetical protein n=1 Tax=Amycolatopsis sp. NPDC059019 TaxID=3346702 RepID=UPI00366F5288